MTGAVPKITVKISLTQLSSFEGSRAEQAESAVTKATALSVGGRREAARRVK